MWQIPVANATEIFSSNAQIFGTLLGLVGLSFVRVAEAKERNVSQLLNSLAENCGAAWKDLEKAGAAPQPDVHIESPEAMGELLSKLKPLVAAEKFKPIWNGYERFLLETSEMRSIKTNFERICWLSGILIVASMAGLLVSFEEHRDLMSLYTLALLLLSAVTLIQAVRFFMIISRIHMFFSYSTD